MPMYRGLLKRLTQEADTNVFVRPACDFISTVIIRTIFIYRLVEHYYRTRINQLNRVGSSLPLILNKNQAMGDRYIRELWEAERSATCPDPPGNIITTQYDDVRGNMGKDISSFPEDTKFHIQVQRILYHYFESLKYEKEPEVQINADDGEAPFTCPDTAFALKIHAMEVHKWGLRGRIQHEFQRQIIDAEMSYNREMRADAQARLDSATKRSSSSSSNPEIVEAREDIDELEATYETLDEERD